MCFIYDIRKLYNMLSNTLKQSYITVGSHFSCAFPLERRDSLSIHILLRLFQLQ